MDLVNNIALFVGYGAILFFLFNLLKFIHSKFIRQGKNLLKYGKWAIVTGCTDGIGAAIATQFAKKGLNIVLVSRSQEKLEQQAKELETKHKVQTRVIPIDFTSTTTNLLDPIRAVVKDLEVGILVNNVGIAYDHAEYFHLLDAEKINKLIQVNVTATTMMTHIVLPSMVERKRGAIINVSSASSLVSEPLYAVYTGSKAYINNFSESLHYEYSKFGIHVQSQLPGLVVSKLSKVRSTSFFIPSPQSYATAFVNQIGYEPVNISFWTHAIQFGVALALPRQYLSNMLLSRGLDIRKRAYKKKEQEQKQQ